MVALTRRFSPVLTARLCAGWEAPLQPHLLESDAQAVWSWQQLHPGRSRHSAVSFSLFDPTRVT